MTLNPKKIFVNGQEYPNLAALPSPIRKIFEDANKNGIPDILEGKLGGINLVNLLSKAHPSPFMLKGNAYQSFEDLPPQFRELVRNKLGFSGQDFSAASNPSTSLDFNGSYAEKDYTKFFIVLAVFIGIFLFAVGGSILVYFFVRS